MTSAFIKDQRFWLGAGVVLSLALAGFVLARLEWDTFWSTLAGVDTALLLLMVVPMTASIALRALRWTLVSQQPLRLCLRFWAATVLGYFGNYVYPLRAGEVLRVIALNRLAKVPVGQGTASAMLDRVSDVIMLGLMVLIVVAIHGNQLLGIEVIVRVLGVLLFAPLILVLLGLWGHRLNGPITHVSAYLPGPLGSRLPSWYAEALQVVRSYGRLPSLAQIIFITMLAMSADILATWVLLLAFGWSLPITAAITMEAFFALGSMLPSAPGYVGVYQVASVLALAIYGIDASSAVAFSVVLQLALLALVSLKTAWVGYQYKLRPFLMVDRRLPDPVGND